MHIIGELQYYFLPDGFMNHHEIRLKKPRFDWLLQWKDGQPEMGWSDYLAYLVPQLKFSCFCGVSGVSVAGKKS